MPALARCRFARRFPPQADDEDSLRSALREADVIVYDLHGQNDEARFALEGAHQVRAIVRAIDHTHTDPSVLFAHRYRYRAH